MADISRAEVSTLIEENYSHVLLNSAAASSTVLQAVPTISMGTKTTHLPVLATLPVADWVTETAAKPTSEVTWSDLTMVAEEIAVIVPVHENVLDDATVGILTEITTTAGTAIGKVLDAAVLFGTNKPASWVSAALVPAALAASQTTSVTTGAANAADLVGAANRAAKKVAGNGFIPDTMITSLTLRYDVENIRDSQGAPIFRGDNLGGLNTYFNANGAWDYTSATAVVFDSSRVKIGVRQDITAKFLDQATVGSINLAERDMVALRFKARYAYVLGVSATALGTGKVPVATVIGGGS
jgi:HK97 family phage major capsid protein